MQKPHNKEFYIGNVDEETGRKLFAEVEKEPFVCGVSGDKGGWIELVDRDAINAHTKLTFNHILEESTAAIEKIATERKMLGSKKLKIDEMGKLMERVMQEASEAAKSKMSDEELIKGLIREVNDSILHEVALHGAGDLRHYRIIDTVEILDLGLGKSEVVDLLKKLELKASIWLDETRTKVLKIIFEGGDKSEEEAERLRRDVEKVCNELKNRGFKVKVWGHRKQYPVEFELDDIKIVKDGENLD